MKTNFVLGVEQAQAEGRIELPIPVVSTQGSPVIEVEAPNFVVRLPADLNQASASRSVTTVKKYVR